jgi:hypothetical protein
MRRKDRCAVGGMELLESGREAYSKISLKHSAGDKSC